MTVLEALASVPLKHAYARNPDLMTPTIQNMFS